MPNKITVDIEALDYEVTVRDVEEALKKMFTNMPTRVTMSANQHSVVRTAVTAKVICLKCDHERVVTGRDWEEKCPNCGELQYEYDSRFGGF